MISSRTFNRTTANHVWQGIRRVLLFSIVVTSSLVPAGCASLDSNRYAEQSVLTDGDTLLTLVQQIDAGTFLQSRGMLSNGIYDQTYAIGYAAAVAARGNDIYVLDQVSGQLVHINLALGEANELMTLPDPNTHGIYVRRDRTVFVVDKNARAIRQLDDSGRTTRLFEDRRLMPAPVDVAESDWGNVIVVADALSSQLVMFDTLAGVVDVIGSNMSRPSIAQTVHAIAATSNSVYILDPQMSEVMRFGLHGNQIGNYGEDELEIPTALAVDQCGRLFIADQSGQGILVSSSDMMLPAARAKQNAFITDQITDIWVDDNFLYVAAGEQGIRIYLIEPPCAAP